MGNSNGFVNEALIAFAILSVLAGIAVLLLAHNRFVRTLGGLNSFSGALLLIGRLVESFGGPSWMVLALLGGLAVVAVMATLYVFWGGLDTAVRRAK